MIHHARSVRLGFIASCGLLASTAFAAAMPSDLSNVIVVNPQFYEPWAVYAYDPGEGTWTQFGDVTWTQTATSLNRTGFVVEATSPTATVASTYRVVVEIMGASVELYIVPSQTQQLTPGEKATLRLNNLF